VVSVTFSPLRVSTESLHLLFAGRPAARSGRSRQTWTKHPREETLDDPGVQHRLGVPLPVHRDPVSHADGRPPRGFSRGRVMNAAADVTGREFGVNGVQCRATAPRRSPFTTVLNVLGESLLASDAYTYGHCRRVADYALAIAGALGFDAHQLELVRLGANLHDVGKIRLPRQILRKEGRLSPAEFELVKMHPIWGLELLADANLPTEVEATIRWHHEKRDGTGYPDGLRGEEIPVYPMIIGVADVYDALTSHRSYRAALTADRAIGLMDERRGWWSPEVYRAFQVAIARPVFRRQEARMPSWKVTGPRRALSLGALA
jgi:putative nucleotidyltransferase with HDIG domain